MTSFHTPEAVGATYDVEEELAHLHPFAVEQGWVNSDLVVAERERAAVVGRALARSLPLGGTRGVVAKGRIPRPPFVAFSCPTHGTRNARHIVLHTTEGGGTIESLARYFRGTRDQLGISYMVEPQGRVGSLGSFPAKTYHVGLENSVCIGIEQFGYARTTNRDWFAKYQRQLRSSVWTVAWISQQLEIPLRQSAVGRRWIYPSGVCEHKDVPTNDHVDCGTGYPLGWIIETAAKWQASGVPLWVRIQTPKK